MKNKKYYVFKYLPKTFKYGTKKYIVYQFFDGATLYLPLKKLTPPKTNET